MFFNSYRSPRWRSEDFSAYTYLWRLKTFRLRSLRSALRCADEWKAVQISAGDLLGRDQVPVSRVIGKVGHSTQSSHPRVWRRRGSRTGADTANGSPLVAKCLPIAGENSPSHQRLGLHGFLPHVPKDAFRCSARTW